MWFGTQHHSEWVTCPLRGAEMTPESWGLEGTYLSGGGFVRQSQDSHRQYIFEWSGASSRASAETLQAYRDGVYNKAPSDLIYFIDPLIYSRNILPKRWAQPGILTRPQTTVFSSLGSVYPVETPTSLLGALRLPLRGAHISSPFTSSTQFNSSEVPSIGSTWVPIPPGETLSLVAWWGNPENPGFGVYVKIQNADGSWEDAQKVETMGVRVSGVRGLLLGVVGSFDYYGARAVIGRGDDWADPVVYEWSGTPNDSTSTQTTADGVDTNLFENPRFVTPGSSGEVLKHSNADVYKQGRLVGAGGLGNELVLTGTPGGDVPEWALPFGATRGRINMTGPGLVTVKARVRIPEGYDASEDFDHDDTPNEQLAARALRVARDAGFADSVIAQAPATPGEYELSVTYNATDSRLAVSLGGSGKPGQQITRLRGVTVGEGEYDGPRHCGSSP